MYAAISGPSSNQKCAVCVCVCSARLPEQQRQQQAAARRPGGIMLKPCIPTKRTPQALASFQDIQSQHTHAWATAP
jgi:hypothetical protein